MSQKEYYVYILASQKYGTLYIGITNNLLKRVYQHKEGLVAGFTKKYHVHKLVYYEVHGDVNEAILREKQMKKWRRDWKINLIERDYPQWLDIYCELTGQMGSRLRGNDRPCYVDLTLKQALQNAIMRKKQIHKLRRDCKI